MVSEKKLINSISSVSKSTPIYIVGGAVRDKLLKRKTYDFDLVVKTNPQRLSQTIARKIKGKAFVLDAKRHVYRIAHRSGYQIDISKFQGSTFEKDIDRRDITINALAIPLNRWGHKDWKKFVIDRHKGINDLKRKKIELVSEKALQDDPLRILRCFRMATELDFSISPKTLRLLKKHRKKIKKPAPERVREEFLKIFSTPMCYSILLELDNVGIWDVLIPEVKELRKTGHKYYGKGGVLKHTLDAVFHLESIIKNLKSWFPKHYKKINAHLHETLNGYPRLAHLKWGTLLHDFGKPDTAKVINGRLRFFDHEYVGAKKIQRFSNRFRWSTEEKNRYATYVRHHMRPGNLATQENLTEKAINRFFRDLNDDAIGMLLVSLGDHMTYLTAKELKKRSSDHEKTTIRLINHFYKNSKKINPPKIIDGYAVMKEFKLDPSPLIGELLNLVKEAQGEGKIKTKPQAISFLKKHIPQMKGVVSR